MRVNILCPQWGHEHLDIAEFVEKVKAAGYDGIDTWVPAEKSQRTRLLRCMEEYELVMVAHQYRASGSGIAEYCRDFEYHLNEAMELQPVLINSHSGRDWFTLEQQLAVIDTAAEFETMNGCRVVHETHRGRLGFCPAAFYELAIRKPDMRITADFSHWVCVTESYLEGFSEILSLAIDRTSHVHARVGFPQGPQVPDPRLPQWAEAWHHFTNWWEEIVSRSIRRGNAMLTITPEFGPPPYMWTDSIYHQPIANQWDINLYIQHWFRNHFATTISND